MFTEVVTSERNDRSSYYQSYTGRIGNIKKSCKTYKRNRKKCEYILLIILGLAESLKMMNRRAQPYCSLTAYISESIKGSDVKF